MDEVSDVDDKFDETKNGFSIASLVLGIVSIVLSCVGFGVIAGILAIIFSSIALYNKQGNKDMAIAGLVLGILSLVGMVLAITLLGFSIFSAYWISSLFYI